MNIPDILQITAVLLEIVVMVTGALIATRKKKVYGWFIATTFALFVIFDLARIFALAVPDGLHALIFLIACGSMVYAGWLIWKEG